MSLPARILLGTSILAVGSLTVASLALVAVIPAWGVLFFFVLPSLFFAVWSAGEFAPLVWRRAATPLRRSWRLSRFAAPARATTLPPPPAPRAKRQPRALPRRIRSVTGLLEVAARTWLVAMRVFLAALRSPRVRRTFNVVFGLAALATLALVAWEFRRIGWPLDRARGPATAAAAALFLSTFALRALAWQLLFRPFERPRSLTLVASFGVASVAALALPSRVDDAITIGLVRRYGRRAPSVGTIALSLFLLGLMDMAALTPFALFAAVGVRGSVAIRVTMLALTGIGVGAGALAAALPSIRTSERLIRFRLGHWLALHAPASRRDAAWSWFLVGASWATRAAGLFVLLDALGLRTSFAVATAYVVAGAGAAALPLGPAGAATQAGVGAAVLTGAGIGAADAIALAVAAQALTVAAGATFAAFGGIAHATSGRRRRT